MAFEYEVYAVDQLTCYLHDGLACHHPLAVVQVTELHSFILADGHPGGFDDITPQDGVFAEGDISHALMLTT